jgi:hypothetical protein
MVITIVYRLAKGALAGRLMPRLTAARCALARAASLNGETSNHRLTPRFSLRQQEG